MPPKLYEAFSSLGWSAFSSLLSDYYKQNKLLIVQDYDLYLINGRERCRVWVKDDFLHVEPYHWETKLHTKFNPFKRGFTNAKMGWWFLPSFKIFRNDLNT